MAKNLEMDFATTKLEPEISFGLIHLVGADLLPLSDGFATTSPGEITLRLSADLPAPWAGTSMVAIHMFQFPRGKAEFDRIVAWYGEGRAKRARLPEKVSFNPDMLAIQDPPQGWMHDGFARSGRDIVHIYQSPKRGILIRHARPGALSTQARARFVLRGLLAVLDRSLFSCGANVQVLSTSVPSKLDLTFS